MRNKWNGIFSLEILKSKFKKIKWISLYLLIPMVILGCEDKETEKLNQNNNLIVIIMEILPAMVNYCPQAEFVVEKGTEYQIALQKDKSSWFQFSPNGNITPPEEKRDYFLTVTKDSSTSISLRPWTSCKTFSSPSRSTMTPQSATPTEVIFKIEKDSVQFSETNRFRIELNSDTQTTVKIIQN